MPAHRVITAGRRASLLLALALSLAACVVYPGAIEPGMSRADIVARFGAPAFEAHDAREWVVVFTTQPRGQEAYRALLDTAGRVTSVVQVLDLADFADVKVGQWTRDDVRSHFGPPADERPLSGYATWEYRFKQDGTFDALMTIYFDAAGRVARMENGPDPLHDPNIK
jgi:outer membrane protein assembly factor BamE (lipoprotein component of BamABCDE complex)